MSNIGIPLIYKFTSKNWRHDFLKLKSRPQASICYFNLNQSYFLNYHIQKILNSPITNHQS